MKANFRKQAGVTLTELILAIALIAVLATVSVLLLDPQEKRAKARDNRRISDLTTLDRSINEYLLDTGNYPDAPLTLRDSTTLPPGGIALDRSADGWIDANLSTYTSHLPLDPINDSTYRYYYYRDTNGYELNAVIEFLTADAANDGGNDPARYEIGNKLDLISP